MARMERVGYQVGPNAPKEDKHAQRRAVTVTCFVLGKRKWCCTNNQIAVGVMSRAPPLAGR